MVEVNYPMLIHKIKVFSLLIAGETVDKEQTISIIRRTVHNIIEFTNKHQQNNGRKLYYTNPIIFSILFDQLYFKKLKTQNYPENT